MIEPKDVDLLTEDIGQVLHAAQFCGTVLMSRNGLFHTRFPNRNIAVRLTLKSETTYFPIIIGYDKFVDGLYHP